MADQKKYYYLKLKDDFFNQEDIKLLESQKNGMIYVNIYLKLCLLSLKNRGELKYKDCIPYDEKMLATILNSDIDNIRCALKILQEMGMIQKLKDGTIFMLEIETLIGKSSDEAERKKEYRVRINERKLLGQITDNVQTNNIQNVQTKSTIIRDKEFKDKDIINNKSEKCNSQFKFKPLLDYFNQVTGKKFTEMSYSDQMKIKGLILKGFTLDDFKYVIDIKTAEWLNTSFAKNLTFSTLFGDKFQNYRNQEKVIEPRSALEIIAEMNAEKKKKEQEENGENDVF